MNTMQSRTNNNLAHILMGILVFGSIWGLLEATLGGFLNLIIFPNKGAIMAGMGFAIMATALAIYKKPAMLPGIGIVAAAFKWLNAWLLFVPPTAVQIINPAMAIFLESLAFGLLAVFFMKRMEKTAHIGIAVGAISALMAAVAYVYFAIYVTNSPLFARIGVKNIGEFIAGPALVQAVFAGVMLPAGYLVGRKLSHAVTSLTVRAPLYYATSAAIFVLCAVISGISVSIFK